ncbi:hypothetical protein [Sinosporangium siamense]|uniref:Uncharacterized protein n=1 Tax=Sinosporangium siamense TaxID=1367973 RepID=A0A919RSR8_9ACTN|nr:hypothetical protein [Sinosporangium siamense]GII97614.1 hypothetical protein Ssi02_78450 [Sinosporangium siamense]
MAKAESRTPWRSGVLSAVGMALLASATNVMINYATTEATALRWTGVVALTLASGLGVALAQSRRQRSESQSAEKPAVHLRIVNPGKTIDLKVYSQEVALQAGYIDQWIRTAHGENEKIESEEASGHD